MRVSEKQTASIRIGRANSQCGCRIQRRVLLCSECAARPLNSRKRSDAFAQSSGCAQRKQLAIAVAIAKFVTRVRAKIFVRLPAKPDCGAVKAGVRTGQMESAFKAQLEREFFRQRQTILQTHYRKPVRAIDSVFQLIAAGHRGVLANPRLDPESSFAPGITHGEARGRKVANRINRGRGQALSEEKFCQRAHLVSRSQRCLIWVSRIGFTKVLLALG